MATGRGLGAAFELAWAAGPRCRVALAAESAVARRWLVRVLIPSYEPAQWQPTQDGSSSGGLAVQWNLRPFRPLQFPLSSDPESAPWSDSVVLGLGDVAPGITVRWHFTPLDTGESLVSFPEATAGHSSERGGGTRLPLAAPVRSLRDRTIERPVGLAWWVRGSVESTPAARGAAPATRLVRLIESASKDPSGNRLSGRRLRRWWPWGFSGFPITGAELTGFLPSPWTRIRPESGSSAPAHPHLWVGRSSQGASVGLPFDRDEGRHLLVLGETGMGKSSALVGLARQAVAHAGLLLFDPVGETASSLIAALPEDALERALMISPLRSPAAINALESPAGSSEPDEHLRGRQTADLVDALRRVRAARYADSSFWGPRIEEVTRRAVSLTSSFPGGTLEDAVRLLEGAYDPPPTVPAAARGALASLRDRLRDRPEEAEGARRLLSEVTENPILRQMLCSREPRLTVSELVAPGRITVVSADAAQVGESTARYLMATYLALVWPRVLQRSMRSKLFVVMDEAQWYAHDSAVQILRLGRRFNVHLWTATQALSSLPEAFAEAVVTNASDVLLFRGSPDDARAFERWGTAVRVDSMLRLGRGSAALLRGKGEEVDWVRVAPLTSPSEDPVKEGRLTEAARGFWPFERGSGPPEPPPPVPVAGRLDPAVASDALLLVLWVAVAEFADALPARVPLARLRRAADPDGEEVRALGRELAREGVLEASGRDASGSFWSIHRDRLASHLAGRLSAEGISWATARWRISAS